MAADIIKILQKIHGTSAPEDPYVDGIYWELTQKLLNGNAGVYGDIKSIYAALGSGQFKEDYLDFISKYSDFKPKYADFIPKYEDFVPKYADTLIKWQETIDNTNTTIAARDTALLHKWDTEADNNTARSYASEAEDIPVTEWSSNGDGTFTTTTTDKFSSLHNRIKTEQAEAKVAPHYDAIDSIASDLDALNSIYADKPSLDSIYDDLDGIVNIASNLPELLEADTNAALAVSKAEEASKWADSAEEVEGGRYSAKYWADNAESVVNDGALLVANDLSDLDDVNAARGNLKVDDDFNIVSDCISVINNISTAYAEVAANGSPVFDDIPTSATSLEFSIVSSKAKECVIADESANIITCKKDIDYNVFAILDFTSTGSGAAVVTVNVINTADDSVIGALTFNVDEPDTATIKLSDSLLIDTANIGIPLNIKFEIVSSIEGYALNTCRLFTTAAARLIEATVAPTISGNTTVNENTLATYSYSSEDFSHTVVYADKGVISAHNHLTKVFTYMAPDIKNDTDTTDVIRCYSTSDGKARSDEGTISLNIPYVPIIADDAISNANYQTNEAVNDGWNY